MVDSYKIDPQLVTIKNELLNDIKKLLEDKRFDQEDAPLVLAATLAISYANEFFRMAEVISRQINTKRG